ncbi:hypothetical protein TSTA_110610 [Talaromyces stipitatus ATCC 10500]|uniref:Uncharacterized protein n=1 Tax=Talaromyces stipitatus (strain ATCC 10500 / CBS 375.48 / QM 6759 / NRRL 1006) TaxID=441959 RepID=B8MUV3_TALSN|nr:uncharacterized protein TSTA_110610 [Talaromyces stipitatus ATCC 10500]EED11882.1 hypothetical protein TSTA_110610 [Talaromyces stipitatus ATCC 10500]
MLYKAELRKNYKASEQAAFGIAFPSMVTTNYTVRKLAQSLKDFVQESTNKKRKKFSSHLAKAIEYRTLAAKEYESHYARLCTGDEKLASQLQCQIKNHEYYLNQMRLVLSLASNKRAATVTVSSNQQDQEFQLDEGENAAVPTEFTASNEEAESVTKLPPGPVKQKKEKSFDEEEFAMFCTGLSIAIHDIISIWERAVKGSIRCSVAAAITSCLYRIIKSDLYAAQQIYPHWFDNAFLQAREYHLIQDLKLKVMRKYLCVESGGAGDDADSIKRIITEALQVPSIGPIYLSDMIKTILMKEMKVTVPDFHVFEFSIGVHISIHAKSTPERSDQIEKIRSATGEELLHLQAVLRRHKVLKFDKDSGEERFLGKVKELVSRIQNMTQPSIICSIALWIEYHLSEVYQALLAYPLIPTMIHVYIYLRLKASVNKLENLETFCEQYGATLFWNGRPSTLEGWETAVKQWVITANNNSPKIAESRHKAFASLITTLVKNEYALNTDVISQLEEGSGNASETLEALKLKLQSEEITDTVLLSDAILAVVRAFAKQEMMGANAAIYIYSIRQLDSAPAFIEQIHSKWEAYLNGRPAWKKEFYRKSFRSKITVDGKGPNDK